MHKGEFLLFDIETDGLYFDTTTVHCLVIYDLADGEEIVCEGTEKFHKGTQPSMEDGLRMLMAAKGLTGHNILGYDLPVLQKLFPWFHWKGLRIYDTLVMSQLLFPQIKEQDFVAWREGRLPGKLIGRHGLEAWGARLDCAKIDYKTWAVEAGIPKEDIFKVYTAEMLDYCIQDVRLNVRVFKMLRKKKTTDFAQNLEHRLAWLMTQQEISGFPFDYDKAQALYAELTAELVEPLSRAKEIFPPWFIGRGTVTPKSTLNKGLPQFGKRMEPRYHKVSGKRIKDEEVFNVYAEFTEGHPYTKVELHEFNPKSRQDVIDRLMTVYGWQPEEQTETGEWALSDDTLMSLPYEVAPLLAKAYMIEKRKAMLGDGSQAWITRARHHEDGIWRVHGRCNPLGTGTRRATHSNPNMGQVPSIKNAKGIVPYGRECRELFYAPPGFKLVGVDASGLELRMLGHYLAPFDGGSYATIASTGDVHTANQSYVGLATRDIAKRWIYAFLYGSGAYLLGAIAGMDVEGGEVKKWLSTPQASNQNSLKWAKIGLDRDKLPMNDLNLATYLKGDILKKNVKVNFPGLKDMLADFEEEFSRNGKFLQTVDGGYIFGRSRHSVLNFKLQSGGAVVCKAWLDEKDRAFTENGWEYGKDWLDCAWVHDETQFLAREEIAEDAGRIAAECVARAGRSLNLRVPLAGEAKVGRNWAETH